MRKYFDDWYRIRANMQTVDQAANVVNEVIGLGLAAGLGGAAGYGIKRGIDWLKGRSQANRLASRRAAQDPRDPRNMPASYADLINSPHWQNLIDQFADNLGIPRVSINDPLGSSLSKIAAARLYGRDMGAVEEGDLAHVWEAIDRPMPGARRTKANPVVPTIAKHFGITRPLVIPMKVPGVIATMRYSITQDANEYDKRVAKAMRSSSYVSQGKPEADTSNVTDPTLGGGSPNSPFAMGRGYGHKGTAGRGIVAQLKSLIAPLEAKESATPPTITVPEAKQLRIWRRFLDLYTGKWRP